MASGRQNEGTESLTTRPQIANAGSTNSPNVAFNIVVNSEKSDTQKEKTLIAEESPIVPIGLAVSPELSAAVKPAQQNMSNLSLKPQDSFTKVREIIIEDLVKQKKINRNDGEALQRAIDHVMCETVEVLSWLPLDEVSTVVIHYAYPLFGTMYKAVSEAGTFNYNTNNTIHVREILVNADSAKPRKFLSNQSHSLQLNDSTVIIPICYGTDHHLSGEDLKKVINFYLAKGAKTVRVYLGEYNSIDHPIEQIDEIANLKRAAWLEKNKALVEKADSKVQVVLRSNWIKEDCYAQAQEFMEKRLLQNKEIYNAIISDAMRYVSGKIKSYSPNLNLSSQQEQEILEELNVATEKVGRLYPPEGKDPVVERVLQEVASSKDSQAVTNLALFTASYMKHSHSIFSPKHATLKKSPTPEIKSNTQSSMQGR